MRKLAVQCAAGRTVTSDNQNTKLEIYVHVKSCGNSESTCQFRLGIRLSIPILRIKLAAEVGKGPIHRARTNHRLSMLNPIVLEPPAHFLRAGHLFHESRAQWSNGRLAAYLYTSHILRFVLFVLP